MGSTVTWKRKDPNTVRFRPGWIFSTSGTDFSSSAAVWRGGDFFSYAAVPPSGYLAVPDQVTTSYRTGRGIPLEDSVVEDAFNSAPSVAAGEARFLGRLSEVDGSNQTSWDNGHSFSSESHFLDVSHHQVKLSSSTGGASYVGPLICLPSKTGIKWYSGSSASGLISKYGPAAIAATAPTNPASSGGQGFYELLADGLPSIPKAGIGALDSIWHTMRALAHGNLSVQFDWLPFIGDLRSTLHALTNASKLVRQYHRDSGRVVRRRMTFPATKVTTDLGSSSAISVSGALCSPPGVDTSKGWSLPSAPHQERFIFHTGTGSAVAETKVVTTRVWFSGAYSYFVPEAKPGFIGQLERYEEDANHLLGLELTPSLLWQLTPWSWLLDWKTQIGNSIKNFSALQTDSLVIRYGYLMVETTTEHTVTLRQLYTGFSGVNGFPTNPVTCSSTYTTVLKERFRATPYGFGVDMSGLSDRRWSILASLGMTRSSKKLRVDD